jgi:hypothetical protein
MVLLKRVILLAARGVPPTTDTVSIFVHPRARRARRSFESRGAVRWRVNVGRDVFNGVEYA